MEDVNIIAGDCIVLCCCCQCMILQILILMLIKLPHKLLRKTKEYAKRFRSGKRGTEQIEMSRNVEDSFTSFGSSSRIDMADFCSVDCMSEIEKVLEDFSGRGEFAFGSFWGADVSSSKCFHSCFKDDHLDYEVVGYRLMELFGSTANFSSH